MGILPYDMLSGGRKSMGGGGGSHVTLGLSYNMGFNKHFNIITDFGKYWSLNCQCTIFDIIHWVQIKMVIEYHMTTNVYNICVRGCVASRTIIV